MTPDLILTNARVLTMDPGQPHAEAVAIAGDRIVAVGTTREVERLEGAATEVFDAKGATVLPVFVESYLHLVLSGAALPRAGLCRDASARGR